MSLLGRALMRPVALATRVQATARSTTVNIAFKTATVNTPTIMSMTTLATTPAKAEAPSATTAKTAPHSGKFLPAYCGVSCSSGLSLPLPLHRGFSTIKEVIPGFKRRPMKKFFQEYDMHFDAQLKELEREKRESGKNWDIVAAAFLERPQVIVSEPHPDVANYYEVKDEIDRKYLVPFDGFLSGQEAYESVYKEAQEMVEAQKEARAAGEDMDEAQMRNEILQKYAGSETGQKIIEQYDLLTYKDPSRITKADQEDNRRSLNRALDERLFLILKKDRETHNWQFPQLAHVDPDPAEYEGKFLPGLRETAEEAVAHFAGKAMQGYYYSNAPQGFYYYKYPEEANKADSFGAKVFFYRVRYLKGAPKPANGFVDFAWVTRDELKEYFDLDTFTFVRQMV